VISLIRSLRPYSKIQITNGMNLTYVASKQGRAMSAFTNSFIPKDTDGWWHSAPLARVRALMRKKHEGFGQGIVYTEEECMRLWDEGGIALPDDGESGNVGSSSKGPSIVELRRYSKKKNRAKAQLTEDEKRVSYMGTLVTIEITYFTLFVCWVGCKTRGSTPAGRRRCHGIHLKWATLTHPSFAPLSSVCYSTHFRSYLFR